MTVIVTEWSPTSLSDGVPDRVAVPSPASDIESHDGHVVHAMVQESLESLSSSLVVTLYEYVASSLTEVTAELDTLGASLVLATVMVNVWVPEALAASVTVTVTA